MFRGNLQRTGVYQGEAPQGRIAWRHTVAGGEITSPVVVEGGTVFFGSTGDSERKRRFWALDAATGSRKWSLPLENEAKVAAAAGEGLVCVPDGLVVRCVEADTGVERWRLPMRGIVAGGIAVQDGMAYFGEEGVAGTGHFFHAIDLRTGEPVWRVGMDEPTVTAPVVDGDALFLVTLDENAMLTSVVFRNAYCAAVALNVRTGRIKWRNQSIREAVHATPTLAGGVLLVPGERSIRAYQAATGSDLWQWELGQERVRGSLAVSEGVTFFGTGEGLSARKMAGGETLWQFRVRDEEAEEEDSDPMYLASASSVSVARDTAIVALANGKIYGVDCATGRKRWECAMDELEEGDFDGFLEDRMAAAIEGGMAFFGAGNTVYAVR